MNKTPSKISVIFAGEDFAGQDADHPLIESRIEGGTEKTAVRVRAMPARHLGRVVQLADKEAALLEFLCLIPAPEVPAADAAPCEIAGWQRVPEGWADNLTDDSHILLCEAVKRQNFSRATKWADRQLVAKQLTGDYEAKVMETIEPLLMRMFSSAGLSPQRSASPASPTTKS